MTFYMKRLALLMLMTGCAALPLVLDDQVDSFVARFYKSQSAQTMPYRLFIPAEYKEALQGAAIPTDPLAARRGRRRIE